MRRAARNVVPNVCSVARNASGRPAGEDAYAKFYAIFMRRPCTAGSLPADAGPGAGADHGTCRTGCRIMPFWPCRKGIAGAVDIRVCAGDYRPCMCKHLEDVPGLWAA